ncbi:MAG TPA: 30S ribosomal protein S8 [Anaerolineae bacterium]|uniref:Small ribosomal subunit protein uS8 n=1 Tax=uncultured Chloroflexi bacterium Rifle_16ft_4_minimus_3189 TaxID=1665068 RepID=A0A0H4T5L1_9CHLR|nr:30S ribosomal protein S8, small subunit ribosomal protein S8 [uncultured Chloroflexi bacterium Rifle_16ft_4_minimus_3189]HKZ84594.1 30S ribosomal protein S8 [Anaerolineae bacterium]
MNISDPISDMLTRVRNAIAVRHASVALPSSQIKIAIATILREEGYIQDFEVTESGKRKTLRLWLKYTGERRNRQPAISGLQRVSRPGRRVYTSKDSIPWVLSGMGVAILSTPKGVITGQQARRLNVGGEVLCYVW